jgi:protein-tyrosine-phosphatase
MDASVEARAARHGALSDPLRVAIVDELVLSDRSPRELLDRLDVASNLLAHHLDVLERAGLIVRVRSSGDARRRYVHLKADALRDLVPMPRLRGSEALFVCSRNSARSQLAAALWRRTGAKAVSAGTHPAETIHPGARAAARRAGLDLGESTPQALDAVGRLPALVVTVCDQAHEELGASVDHLHWSIGDPVEVGTARAFDQARAELAARIAQLTGGAS